MGSFKIFTIPAPRTHTQPAYTHMTISNGIQNVERIAEGTPTENNFNPLAFAAPTSFGRTHKRRIEEREGGERETFQYNLLARQWRVTYDMVPVCKPISLYLFTLLLKLMARTHTDTFGIPSTFLAINKWMKYIGSVACIRDFYQANGCRTQHSHRIATETNVSRVINSFRSWPKV